MKVEFDVKSAKDVPAGEVFMKEKEPSLYMRLYKLDDTSQDGFVGYVDLETGEIGQIRGDEPVYLVDFSIHIKLRAKSE